MAELWLSTAAVCPTALAVRKASAPHLMQCQKLVVNRDRVWLEMLQYDHERSAGLAARNHARILLLGVIVRGRWFLLE